METKISRIDDVRVRAASDVINRNGDWCRTFIPGTETSQSVEFDPRANFARNEFSHFVLRERPPGQRGENFEQNVWIGERTKKHKFADNTISSDLASGCCCRSVLARVRSVCVGGKAARVCYSVLKSFARYSSIVSLLWLATSCSRSVACN